MYSAWPRIFFSACLAEHSSGYNCLPAQMWTTIRDGDGCFRAKHSSVSSVYKTTYFLKIQQAG